MDREQTGDGAAAAAVLGHPVVQAALKLFDSEVTEVRLAPPAETPRAA